MLNKFHVDILSYKGNMGKMGAFRVKLGPNEDHFSGLVLMGTKSSIEDLFATTV